MSSRYDILLAWWRDAIVNEATVAKAMDAVGCSYAENILVNLNKKVQLQFLKCVYVSLIRCASLVL